MLVVVQVFARHVVFRNLVSGHLCHIWISRIFDTVYSIRFERIAFFCQLLHTFGICNRGVRNLLSRPRTAQRSQAPFPYVFFDYGSSCFLTPAERPSSVTRSRRDKRDCTHGTLPRRTENEYEWPSPGAGGPVSSSTRSKVTPVHTGAALARRPDSVC